MKDHRCVHLDFHTSPEISVGEDFDKEEFKAALKTAHLDSITLFAKCHHGYFYYESPKFAVHPLLKKPLLDLQVEACKEVGVSSKIYISAGYDEAATGEHPEWLLVPEDGTPQNQLHGHFHVVCFNNAYTDLLVEQTKEVTERYMPDGLFFDIIAEHACVCPNCRRDMAQKGLNYLDHKDVMKQARDVLHTWTRRVTEAARAIKPDVMVFFNAGDFPVGRHDRMEFCDQLEAESLPTGGWGYDHFPLSMAYIRRRGKNCIGMTGKFHRSWGEFGGYKYKDALLYEGAQCLAFDAGMSVGDQLHPSGRVDAYTYENIGNAMAYIEEREPWRGGDFMAEVAVLSDMWEQKDTTDGRVLAKLGRTGAGRMLFESKYLFDLIEYTEISNKYRFILLADEQSELNEDEYKALRRYVEAGGKIIAGGKAPLYQGKMAFDLGCEFVGRAPYQPSYLQADYPLDAASGMTMVLYEPFYTVNLTGKKLADQVQPSFQRGYTHFCSHNNTPCDFGKRVPGITEGSEGIYVAAEILSDYANIGSMNAKQLMLPLFRKYCPNKTVATNLPTSGKAALYEKDGSYILHLLYANTMKRGRDIEVIEDLVTLCDIDVTLRLPRPVTKAVLRPEGREIPLTVKDGTVSFRLDRLHCSAIVELC